VIPTAIDVISLVSAEERRAAFTEQAQLARSPWRFVDAATTPTPLIRYSESRAVRRFGRALSRGEIGCFVSHYAVWKSLLASTDQQRLVLEDDVIVDWNTIDRLLELDLGSMGLDLVRLYATHPFQHRPAIHHFLGPHTHLVRVQGMFLGAQGYFLSRAAAERLLRLATSIEMPVDWLMGRYWEYGFPNYCVFPFPIIERYVPSNIGDRSNFAPPSGMDRMVRFGWRVADRISRGFADHVRFRKNPFGSTPDAGPSFADRHRSNSTA
jgi:glycosyl transferase family 25